MKDWDLPKKVIAIALTILVLADVFITTAQTISTKAGTIKKVEGEVFYHCHKNEKDARVAEVGIKLHEEDFVMTGAKGSLILSLNPDSYLLISSNSYVRVKDTSLDNMHFDIKRGEIFVLSKNFKHQAALFVHTPPQLLAFRKRGSYRIFVKENGETEASVFDGEIHYVDANGKLNKVKKGSQVNFVKNESGITIDHLAKDNAR